MLCVLPSKSSNLYGKSPILCCGLLHKKDGGMGGGGYRITRQGCKDNFLTLIGIQTKEQGQFFNR